MTNPNDFIGNRTRALPRPTVPPRAPRMNYESRPIMTDEVSIHGDVILSDKSHHFSLTSFGATGGRQLGHCAVSRGTRDPVQRAANVDSYSPYSENALQIDDFGSLTCVTSNKNLVHCMLKFHEISQPTGSDQRQLSHKIICLCIQTIC
jgi:hypothetical protein